MRRFLTIFLLLAVFFVPAAWPQGGNSTVRGFVRDQAQAVIPNATVTLTNLGTNIARTTTSNEAGLYVFPGVIPGSYRLSGEFSGMQKFEGNLTVQTSTDESIEITLKVASAATSVEVADITPILVTDNATLSQTLERQRIEQMPVLGRGYQNLLQTIPGLIYSNHGHQVGGRALAYGMMVGSTAVTMDGNPMTEEHGGWDLPRLPDLDTIQEIHVETNNSSAKFSRPTTIIMSSRSGTNDFHGALFADNRNSGYGVARQRQDNFTKAPYSNRNEYGLSAGGPVSIPKLYNGKNRTFWFFSWEGTRSQLDSTQQQTVPTPEMRNGDFRGLIDSQNRLQVLYDPFTTNPTTWARSPLQYNGIANTVDPKRISPVATYLFNDTRLPTNNINPLLGSNWIGTARRPLEQDTNSIRIDHRITEKDLIYGRFGYNTHFESLGSDFAKFYPIFNDQPIGRYTRWWPNMELSTTWMHTFSPTMTNEMVSTGTRDYSVGGSGYNAGFPVDYAGVLGLPNPLKARNWPSLSIPSLGSFNYTAPLTSTPMYAISNYITFQDNVTKVVQKHELSFGYQYRLFDVPRGNLSTAGTFDSSTGATSLYDTTTNRNSPGAVPQTGANIANFYLGVMNYSTNFVRPRSFLRKHEHALYLQDTFKVSSRLTLNMGLRWEMRTPLRDKDGEATSFDLDNHAYVLASPLSNFIGHGSVIPSLVTGLQNFGGKIESYQDAGLPANLYNTNWKQFGPRVGFAYRAFNGKKAFVLRGGYRISYYPETTGSLYSAYTNAQIMSGSFTNSVTNAAQAPDGIGSYGLRSVPQFVAGVNTPDSVISINDTRLLTRGGFSATRIDPNLVDPMVQDWNLTLEKEVMANTVFRIGLIGNYTKNQSATVSVNSSTPSYIWYATTKTALPTGEFASVATRGYDKQVYGNVGILSPVATDRYNGIEVGIERRFSKGFGYQLFYDMANALVGGGGVSDLNQFLPGAVPTDVNERARFLNYHRDINPPFNANGVGTPKHRVRWNFIADLPVGKGKKFLGNAPKAVDLILGGWQLSGTGFVVSFYSSLPTDVYQNGNPLEYYGYKYPIQDCTAGAGVCYPAYLWFNGYIPTNKINSVDAQGRPNGYMGIPSNYKPAAQPLIPYGSTALPANAPVGTNVSSFWDTNTVWIPLTGVSAPQRTTYDNGLHPWRNQYFLGPYQWFQDAGLTKTFNITERVSFRFNVDMFNVFNHPNNPTGVSSNGVLLVRNSGSPARITQLAARLNW